MVEDESTACDRITSKKECITGAQETGRTMSWNTADNDEQRGDVNTNNSPPYCIQRKVGGQWGVSYNMKFESTASCSAAKKCICKQRLK